MVLQANLIGRVALFAWHSPRSWLTVLCVMTLPLTAVVCSATPSFNRTTEDSKLIENIRARIPGKRPGNMFPTFIRRHKANDFDSVTKPLASTTSHVYFNSATGVVSMANFDEDSSVSTTTAEVSRRSVTIRKALITELTKQRLKATTVTYSTPSSFKFSTPDVTSAATNEHSSKISKTSPISDVTVADLTVTKAETATDIPPRSTITVEGNKSAVTESIYNKLVKKLMDSALVTAEVMDHSKIVGAESVQPCLKEDVAVTVNDLADSNELVSEKITTVREISTSSPLSTNAKDDNLIKHLLITKHSTLGGDNFIDHSDDDSFEEVDSKTYYKRKFDNYYGKKYKFFGKDDILFSRCAVGAVDDSTLHDCCDKWKCVLCRQICDSVFKQES